MLLLPKPGGREKSLVWKFKDLVQFKSSPAPNGLCDLRQVTWPLQASASSSINLQMIFFFFNGRIIALQNFVIFCQTSTWISHGYTYVPSLLNFPPTYRWSLRSLSAPHFYNIKQAEEHLLLKGLEVGQKKMSKRKKALGHMTGMKKDPSPLL